ncbi:ABC transporter permease [Spirochaetia bacterium]|nr:ABC transporter permease [Spirochaetia bacterium]
MKRFPVIVVSFSCILTAIMVCGVLNGSVSLSLPELYRGIRSGDAIISMLLLEIRLPRVLLAAVIGAALSLSGAAFQSFFHNALADPYIIGSSSGAALGAGIAMSMGLVPVGLYAYIGSLGAVILAFGLARPISRGASSTTLLLAGTSISYLCSALLSFVLIIKDKNLNRVYYWLLGSLGGITWREYAAVPVIAAGCFIICMCARHLDLLLQGEEVAESLGVPVQKIRLAVIIGASLTVAASVSCAGIIGFVGLAAPHAARAFTGPVHRRLLPVAALTGAVFLLSADIIARVIAPPLEIPVGIITALGGAPFFLYLLARHQAFQ